MCYESHKVKVIIFMMRGFSIVLCAADAEEEDFSLEKRD